MANLKLSQLASTSSLALTDLLVLIQAAGDNKMTINDFLTAIFGNRIQSLANTGSAGGTIKYLNLGGWKLAWSSNVVNIFTAPSNSSVNAVFTLPAGFFTGIDFVVPSHTASGHTSTFSNLNGVNSSAVQIYVCNVSGGSGNGGIPGFIAIGN